MGGRERKIGSGETRKLKKDGKAIPSKGRRGARPAYKDDTSTRPCDVNATDSIRKGAREAETGKGNRLYTNPC